MSTTIDIPRSYEMLLPVKFLANRDEEVNFIVNTLMPDPNSSIVGKRCFLHGPQGIGKTELCRVAAFELRDHYSDAQVYLQIDEADEEYLSLFKIFETIIHIFDPYVRISDDLETISKQYHAILDNQKILIVVDGLRYDGYLNLIMPPPSCGLLITSNSHLEAVTEGMVKVNELPQEKAEELLLSLCPRVAKSASHLANICGNVPANLCLISGYLKFHQLIEVDDFIGNLEKHVGKFKTDNINLNEAILSYIFNQLTLEEQSFLLQLGIFSDGFTEEFAEGIGYSDADKDAVHTYLDTFTQLNLLIFDQKSDRYYLQSGIHNFVLKKSRNVPDVWLRSGKV